MLYGMLGAWLAIAHLAAEAWGYLVSTLGTTTKAIGATVVIFLLRWFTDGGVSNGIPRQ
jgi:hypothetical protein